MSNLTTHSPGYRSTDPDSSKSADSEHRRLGKRATRSAQVLGLISRHPGSTCGELSRYMHDEWPDLPISTAVETPHKRVTNLEELGLIRRGDSRECMDSGRVRITWYATKAGEFELMPIE